MNNDKSTELRASFWRDAASNGGVVGLIFSAVFLAGSYLGFGSPILLLAVLALMIMNYGRKRAAKYDPAELTYGKKVGYNFAMMLFAGFVTGLSAFLFFKLAVPPAELDEMARIAGLKVEEIIQNMNLPQNETMIDPETMIVNMINNPAMMILWGMSLLGIYGGIVGLIFAPFIKPLQPRY